MKGKIRDGIVCMVIMAMACVLVCTFWFKYYAGWEKEYIKGITNDTTYLEKPKDLKDSLRVSATYDSADFQLGY